MLKNKSMNVILIVITALVIIIISGIVMLSTYRDYDAGPPTTKTSSKQFATKEERLEFLKKYLKEYSPINDAEYFIEFYNNVSRVPGPSEWDITVALKVPQDKINDWVIDFDEVNEEDIKLSWWDLLKLDDKGWYRNSKPKFYKRKGQMVYVVIYENEGIILKRVTAM